jgi:hypothetical protein
VNKKRLEERTEAAVAAAIDAGIGAFATPNEASRIVIAPRAPSWNYSFVPPAPASCATARRASATINPVSGNWGSV